VHLHSDPKAVQQGAEEARFDRTRRELTWAARGAPGERTRTSEELAELERLRLEVLENPLSCLYSVVFSLVKRTCRPLVVCI
jgi:hypothetical protein